MQKVGDQGVKVGRRQVSAQIPRHRVLVPRYDVGARVEDRLADVVLGGKARPAGCRERSDVLKRGPQTLPEQVRLVAVPATPGAVELSTPGHRLGRRRLRSAGPNDAPARAAPEGNRAPHAHPSGGLINPPGPGPPRRTPPPPGP